MISPCRVLILNERDPEHPRSGGAEIHVAEIFSRLAARGFEVEWLVSGFRGAARERQLDGMRLRRLGPLPVYYPRALSQCRARSARGEIDVVVECLNKVPFFAPVYARAPVLVLCHHLFGEVAFQQVSWPVAAAVWSLERPVPRLYRRARFLSISDSTSADLESRGIARERIRTSYPGIRHPAPERVGSLETPRPRRVACVGRLEPYKRVDLILRAMARLRARFPDLELVVVGRGSVRGELEALARALGLADRIRFTGFVDDAERDAVLATARLSVCASEKEGWGLTVIESNAVGTPVVARRAPGLRDSVRDGETGLLVDGDDVDAFAAAMERVLADDALAVQLSEAALAWSRRFDWERAADEMAEEIDRVRTGS